MMMVHGGRRERMLDLETSCHTSGRSSDVGRTEERRERRSPWTSKPGGGGGRASGEPIAQGPRMAHVGDLASAPYGAPSLHHLFTSSPHHLVSIGPATLAAASASNRSVTSASANSIAVPGPRDVTSLPSTTCRTRKPACEGELPPSPRPQTRRPPTRRAEMVDMAAHEGGAHAPRAPPSMPRASTQRPGGRWPPRRRGSGRRAGVRPPARRRWRRRPCPPPRAPGAQT